MEKRTTKDLEHELSGCACLDHYLTENSDCVTAELELARELERLMEERSLRRTDVIRSSGLNDIYVYQIFSGKRRPSRNKLLCLFLGMGLSTDDVQYVLKHCGYPPLYAKNRRDSVILFVLKNGLTLLQANELLFEHGEAVLSE